MVFGKFRALVLLTGLIASTFAGTTANAAGCAGSHAGGDWSAYGSDLGNSRTQPAESTITATNAALLTPKWTFSPTAEGGTGSLESTPVVAGGCVYLTTASGYVYALNADTGALVWKNRVEETVTGVCCGGTMFAPAVHNGVVFINVSHNPNTATDHIGPYIIALNATTGSVVWKSAPVAAENGAFTNSSAVVFEGMVWIGICNPEGTYWPTPGIGELDTAGGYALLDERTGAMIHREYTIPADQMAKGFGGGSIWSTIAIDPASKFGYVGTGQPSTSDKESERTNAIIKIDLDRSRATFGQIVDSYKATWDDPPYIDVDMAASPTLYHDANGQQMVADFQKSGWMHAAYTRDMSRAWAEPLSPFGTALGNYTSPATDGKNLFGVGAFPGQIFSVNGQTGIPNWILPIGSPVAANPVSFANGLVYHADGKGVLNIIDAATGAPVLMRPMQVDVSAACTNAGGGVAIARNTVFSVCGDGPGNPIGTNTGKSGWVIAYGL